MTARYDAIVIGSGFGGSIAACRLAQAGERVVVLERGRRWDKAEFPRSVGEVADAFWQNGRSHGFLEYRAFRHVDVIQGAGVGGGSLHYFNVHLRAEPEIFERPPWPRAITRDRLEPYYDLAQDMMESKPLTPPPGQSELPRRTRAFIDAAERTGHPTDLVDIAVFTGADRAHPSSGRPQSPCTYCSNCLFGCHVHAKNTLDLTYLGLAERKHGAEVWPLHEATNIERDRDGGYRVSFQRYGAEPGSPPQPGSVCGKRVVVAAGTLGSSRLLLRCRDRSRSLPELGLALGTRFSINGEYLLGGATETESRIDPALGPPITARVTVKDGNHIVTVQDLGLPDAAFWYLEGLLPPRQGRVRRLLELAKAYALRTLGWNAPTTRLSHEVDALVAGGRTPRLLPYLGMGTDSSDGRLRLRGDDIDAEFDLARNRALYDRIHGAMQAVSGAAGGRFVRSFLWKWPLRKMLTAHPLGGCPMGDDPASSVVDARGQVHGCRDLYVVDGSIIPTALAVNPSLTISALAERSAFWMLHGRDMQPGDTQLPTNG